MIRKNINVLLWSAVLLLADSAFAQGPPPPPPGLPIDGGIFVLLAAGAAYAVKKIREDR